jgi:hypothetical protein
MSDDYFGVCPKCKKANLVNVRRWQFMVCHEHKVKWLIGNNLLDAWKHEDETIWRANQQRIAEYQQIEPYSSYGTLRGRLVRLLKELFRRPAAAMVGETDKAHSDITRMQSDQKRYLRGAIDRIQNACCGQGTLVYCPCSVRRALKLTLQCVDEGFETYFHSPYIEPEDAFAYLLLFHSNISVYRVDAGQLTERDFKRMTASAGFLARAPFQFGAVGEGVVADKNRPIMVISEGIEHIRTQAAKEYSPHIHHVKISHEDEYP